MKHLFFLSVVIAFCCNCNAQLLWKISGNGLSKPSYVFGTHHLAPISILDSIQGFYPAFEETSQVIGEVVMSDMMSPKTMKIMQQEMMIKSDTTFQSLFTPDEYKVISEKVKEHLNFDVALLPKVKPVFLSNNLTAAMYAKTIPDFNPLQQLDNYLQQLGVEKGKTVNGLETLEFQFDLLFNMSSLTRQAEMLLCMINDEEKLLEEAHELTDAYMSQQLDVLEYLSLKDDGSGCAMTPEELKIMNDNRNITWAKKIPAMIRETPGFIVVGALHLTGTNSVLKLLKDLGYTVESVN